jgi:uncharacterized protein YebE (UPF0316 family)
MDITAFINSDAYTLAVLPALIFLARIFDVSFGTIRVIFISKGYKFLAPVLGFFEVLIWLGAIRQIMVNLSNVSCYIAYALGFAAGTFVGIYIEEKISIGNVMIRIITKNDSLELLKALKSEGYVATSSGAKSPSGKVKILYAVVRRHNIPKTIDIIRQFNPHAFYSIEDVRYISEEAVIKPYKRRYRNIFGFYRKGK